MCTHSMQHTLSGVKYWLQQCERFLRKKETLCSSLGVLWLALVVSLQPRLLLVVAVDVPRWAVQAAAELVHVPVWQLQHLKAMLFEECAHRRLVLFDDDLVRRNLRNKSNESWLCSCWWQPVLPHIISVCTRPGNPGISWKMKSVLEYPEMSWNLVSCPWISWKKQSF